MYLILQLQGLELERIQLLPTTRVSREIEELRKKYNKEIRRAKEEPEFYISEVPSAIGHFNKLLSNLKGKQV